MEQPRLRTEACKACVPTACAPKQEKPPQRETHVPQGGAAPTLQLGKSPCSHEDGAQSKLQINNYTDVFKRPDIPPCCWSPSDALLSPPTPWASFSTKTTPLQVSSNFTPFRRDFSILQSESADQFVNPIKPTLPLTRQLNPHLALTCVPLL